MVRIDYDRNLNFVSLRGHAGGGRAGHDPICAAVSILVHTLAAAVMKMEKTGAAVKTDIEICGGRALIACTPCPDRKEEVQKMFDAVCEGWVLLAESYPENVKFIRK